MARRHRHEEHVNHERWVISFADMMTLLFALFVVLYAMGVQDLEKLRQIKQSIQFAFNFAGEGKTKDQGIFDQLKGGGEVAVPAPLITAQDGEMREFLKDALVDYLEIAGRSLEVNQTDDTVSLTARLSDFFPPGQPFPIRPDVLRWLDSTVTASLAFTSDIRVQIRHPVVAIGQTPLGTARTSTDLCYERLMTLDRVLGKNPQVREGMVEVALRPQKVVPGRPLADWEDEATLTIAFSNTRSDGR